MGDNNGWNYRVMVQEDKSGDLYFEIHEVHYKDGVPYVYTKNPMTVGTGSLVGIPWVLAQMKVATTKPALWKGDRFPEEYKEDGD